jgi:hypothetical protein
MDADHTRMTDRLADQGVFRAPGKVAQRLKVGL